MLEDELRSIEKYLRREDKEMLISDLMEYCRDYPNFRALLLDKARIKTSHQKDLLRHLRRELFQVTKTEGRRESWPGEIFFPDYSKVRRHMKALLEAGQADELLKVGPDFFKLATAQIEQIDDEGETLEDVGCCTPLFAEALRQSSLTELEKMVWALEMVLGSDFNLADELEQYLKDDHAPAAWSNFADQLMARLANMSAPKNNFESTYRREQLSDWAIHALNQAGRNTEIQVFLEIEAKKTQRYGRLIKHFLKEGRLEDAEYWILEGRKGIKKGTAEGTQEFRGYLRELRKLQQDWPSLSVLDVEFFVERPGLEHFDECRLTAEKNGVWPELRKTLLDYLAHGHAPWQHPVWPWAGHLGETYGGRHSFPLVENLIEIAIHEDRPDECLLWFDKFSPQHRFIPSGFYEEVAQCLKKFAPERSVAIWKLLAESEIAHVSPSSYVKAGEYLHHAGLVMSEQGRENDWRLYIDSLRNQHRRKKRLLEILDG